MKIQPDTESTNDDQQSSSDLLRISLQNYNQSLSSDQCTDNSPVDPGPLRVVGGNEDEH